jgi:hypothetical protein
MQDTVAHGSGVLHIDPAGDYDNPSQPKEQVQLAQKPFFLSKTDQFGTNCIPDQLGGRRNVELTHCRCAMGLDRLHAEI